KRLEKIWLGLSDKASEQALQPVFRHCGRLCTGQTGSALRLSNKASEQALQQQLVTISMACSEVSVTKPLSRHCDKYNLRPHIRMARVSVTKPLSRHCN